MSADTHIHTSQVRLWDTQWVNVSNHDDCYSSYTKEDAVAKAIQLTEKAIRENFERGCFPPLRAALGEQNDH